jgi:dihydrofolate synthase/folylpolyglutamate synthase
MAANSALVSYADALAYLGAQPNLERGDRLPAELNLDRTRQLLGALDRPDRAYPSILIAGTKGKGSTAAMIERALRGAGYRTGLYTQPHLHSLRERVRLDGAPIDPEAFAAGMEYVRRAVHRSLGRVTAYELMTTLALERFREAGVDVAVLEVGLGGRLDATNVVEAEVSVLTSVSLDHTQILGSTLTAIAREKADIIKIGRPVVSAPQHPDVHAVIWETAQARRAPLQIAGGSGAAWEPTPLGGWDLLVDGERIENLHLALRGGFQRTNAAVASTALAALRQRGLRRIDTEAIRAGLEQTAWPGRFEVVSANPPIVLDGAHNVDSAGRLREAIHEEYPGLLPIYVLGIAADKDAPGILRALTEPAGSDAAPPPAAVVATAAHQPRALSAERLAGLAGEAGVPTEAAPNIQAALARATGWLTSDHVLVVTGSLYVVAEARVLFGLADPTTADDLFDPWAPT